MEIKIGNLSEAAKNRDSKAVKEFLIDMITYNPDTWVAIFSSWTKTGDLDLMDRHFGMGHLAIGGQGDSKVWVIDIPKYYLDMVESWKPLDISFESYDPNFIS